MNKSIDKLKNEYAKIKRSLHCYVMEEDYKRLALKVTSLKELAQIENRSISLYDLNKNKFILKVDKHIELLGYNSQAVNINNIDRYHEMIHCEDLPFMYDSEIQMFYFLRSKSGEEKKDYKLVYDYRVRNRTGSFIRFLHQMVIYELDQQFNSWIVLILSDVISEYPNDEKPKRFIVNTKTKEICLFNEELGVASRLLTKREQEILGLLSQGYNSHEISSKLFISINTVNNHRQRILEKTDTNNIAQAIAYVKIIGLI